MLARAAVAAAVVLAFAAASLGCADLTRPHTITVVKQGAAPAAAPPADD